MSAVDIVLIIALAAAIFFAVRALARGGDCGCGCDQCTRQCRKKK